MKNLETIADELFNKIRGRFPNITVGDDSATITNKPGEARFFEFDFAEGKKVNVNIDENSLTIMYAQNLFSEQEQILKTKWYDFLKELRVFAKKRMLNFDTRDITKSNLDKRDYEYLSTEKQMSESKMYGTSRTSYQDIGTARLVVKHAGPVNHENVAGRTQNVHSIYIESDAGERFKYPFRHMNGARAMAMHVSEGGNAYDDFGKHITGLSEELNKLRKFKTYMNRSSVMAEGLAGYMDVVNERLVAVKKTVESLQRKAYYTETFANFETTVLEEVPEDVSNTWIDELTIRQFNEELKGVFPYVYNLVKEANKIEEVDLSSLSLDDYLKRFEVGDTVLPKEEGPGQAPGKVVKVQDDKCMVKFADGSTEVFTHDELEATDTKNLPEEELSKCCDAPISDGPGDAEGRCTSCGEVVSVDEGRNDGPRSQCCDAPLDNYENGLGICGDCGEHAEAYNDNDEGVIDPGSAYAEKMDAIISQSKHEAPADDRDEQVTSEEQAFEDYKMAAAQAAINGKKEFEYPPKSGKMHDTKMDPKVAKKILGELGKQDDDATTIDISPKGPGDELKQKNEIPLEEFIKSMYDYTSNAFPKGETAVLTAVQKQYGDEMVDEAQVVMKDLLRLEDAEMARIQSLAGLR
jgi:hypothetical protein